MKRLFRAFTGTATAVLTLSTVLTVGFTGVAHAAADTCTWTGAGDGTTFSDGTNWTGCDNAGVPENGDNLVIDVTGLGAVTLNNDISSFSVVNLDLTGDGSFSAISVGGSAITVTGDVSSDTDEVWTFSAPFIFNSTTTITNTATTNLNLTDVSGSGALSIAGDVTVTGSFSLTGAVTVNSGTLTVNYGSGLSVSSLTVADGATVWFATPGFSGTSTINYPITVEGTGDGPGSGAILFENDGNARTFTITSALTLTGNTQFAIYPETTVRVEGPFHGPGFTAAVLGAGTLVVASSDNTTATANSSVTTTASFSAPATPDTGFAFMTANPILTVGIMTAAAGAIVYIARKTRFAHATVAKSTRRK